MHGETLIAALRVMLDSRWTKGVPFVTSQTDFRETDTISAFASVTLIIDDELMIHKSPVRFIRQSFYAAYIFL